LLFVPYVTGGLKELLFSEIIFPSKFALDIFFKKKCEIYYLVFSQDWSRMFCRTMCEAARPAKVQNAEVPRERLPAATGRTNQRAIRLPETVGEVLTASAARQAPPPVAWHAFWSGA